MDGIQQGLEYCVIGVCSAQRSFELRTTIAKYLSRAGGAAVYTNEIYIMNAYYIKGVVDGHVGDARRATIYAA